MLLVTDLDNTLYDWVTYFARSFQAMLRELAQQLELPEERLGKEFKAVHQRYGNSEQPFAVLELPAVRERLPGRSRYELLQALEKPLAAFKEERKRSLRLYPGVSETLQSLDEAGITIVGHTEALAVSSYHRLRLLGVDHYFKHLYALDGELLQHPDPERGEELNPPQGLVREVPRVERKPNPELLRDICAREGVDKSKCWYVGDSLTRDISMAKQAGVQAVWARYGTEFPARHWKTVVEVTHWTEEDVERERRLKQLFSQVQPDFTIDSFAELKRLLALPSLPSTAAAAG
ncbi:MAG TPA: HAD-IA family hydrolase [Acidobacteriota bacterium]|nr:HAD-IA family hydrolase [Acidobacteriota bacterium]